MNGPEADHTAVTLNVYQDGTLVAPADYTIVVDPSSGTAGTFTYTISGLPQYKDDGSPLISTVDETAVPINYEKTLSDDKLIVTNTYKSPTADVTAKKVNGPEADHTAVTPNVYQTAHRLLRRTTRSLWIHHLEQLGRLPIPSAACRGI